MDKAQFWKIIARAREQTTGDCDAFCEALQRLLVALTVEEIIGFDRCVTDYRFLAYRADIWGAAYIMLGGCSNDGFEYFRGWLISQGEEVYFKALADPESLADIDFEEMESADEFECEQLMYTPDRAFEEKTGQKIPDAMIHIGEYPALVGELAAEDEYYERYPKLAARFEG